jgi:hypothetical protein
VFSSVCRAQVTGVAGGFFCDILQAWASSVVDLPGPHSRELAACWFCVFFPKTFENESLKNFCTSIAVYNPSFISGFASRLHIRRDRQNITALFLLLFHKFTRSDLIEFSSKLCVCCNIYIQDLSAARVPRSKLPESVPLVERKIARVFLRFLLLLDFKDLQFRTSHSLDQN